jgi:hypothetical protein
MRKFIAVTVFLFSLCGVRAETGFACGALPTTNTARGWRITDIKHSDERTLTGILKMTAFVPKPLSFSLTSTTFINGEFL